MITVLLEKIITILEGWFQSFTSHTQHVEDKLDSLDQTASDIETNTEPISDIADNTGAVITPIQNIKSNTDSIAQRSQTSANNTTAILNNVSTLSTNTGRAAAFAEDCANNTLEIKDKITTIASDTTQLRADSANIAADVSSINQALGYYLANTPVTEDIEGALCNFDTDLDDYLQKAIVTIPADVTGFSSIEFNICQNNFYNPDWLKLNKYVSGTDGSFNNSSASNAIGIFYAFSNTMILTWNYDNLADSQVRAICFYDKEKNFISSTTYQPTFKSKVITIPADCSYLAITVDKNFTNIQLRPGNTILPYEASKAHSFTISFGSTITDGAEADLLSGLVKVNTTPESFIQIQPIAVRTYKGVNNIYSDIGTSALTYRETLKHYLDKNNQ